MKSYHFQTTKELNSTQQHNRLRLKYRKRILSNVICWKHVQADAITDKVCQVLYLVFVVITNMFTDICVACN